MSQYLATQPAAPPLDWPHYGIGFSGAVKRAFRKYAVFTGRASRSEYWWFALFTLIPIFGLAILAAIFGAVTSPDGGATAGPGALPFSLAGAVSLLVLLVPSIAITVRRLHDAGFSGWLVLLSLVPIASLVVFVFTVLPTSPGAAKYGPPYPPSPPYPTTDPPGPPMR